MAGTTQTSEAAFTHHAPPAAGFIAAIMFPPLMVIAISLREGNFATGSLIPDQISWEHWRLALGFSVEHADGRVTPPPFPVLLWLWNSVKVADHRHRYRGAVHDLRLCLRPYALPGQSDPAERDVDFPDVPAVLSLVALYALFDRLGQYLPFVGLNTHGGVIFAYMGGIALHVWTIKGYFETYRWLAGKRRRWMAQRRGRPSVWSCAAVGTDSGRRIYSVVHCRDYRSTGGLAAAARCEQLYSPSVCNSISTRRTICGRLCRRGGALRHSDYGCLPAGPALAG